MEEMFSIFFIIWNYQKPLLWSIGFDLVLIYLKFMYLFRWEINWKEGEMILIQNEWDFSETVKFVTLVEDEMKIILNGVVFDPLSSTIGSSLSERHQQV